MKPEHIEIAEQIARDASCSQGEFNQRVLSIIPYLTDVCDRASLMGVQRPEDVARAGWKFVHVKRWHTLIHVPESIADEVRDALALPPLWAREEIAPRTAFLINEIIEKAHLMMTGKASYLQHIVKCAEQLKERPLSSTAGQEWRGILPRVIAHLEDGEGHDEGAFDESCDTCLLLRDLRALLPAPPVAEPIVADKQTPETK